MVAGGTSGLVAFIFVGGEILVCALVKAFWSNHLVLIQVCHDEYGCGTVC